MTKYHQLSEQCPKIMTGLCQKRDKKRGVLKGQLNLSREGREGGEVHRTGIFVDIATQMNLAPFRSDIVGNMKGRWYKNWFSPVPGAGC
jgi:hypothetical protein